MTCPHFIIIGAMKAGSTSLFRWLGEHSRVRLPEVKEPAFFSLEPQWQRGLAWYQALFPTLDVDHITGEASVHYTDPAVSGRAAQRVKAALPEVRLIFLARDPVERLRSHYRHEVQRGREHRTMREALNSSDQPYVRCSQYTRALAPWLEQFPRSTILTLRFEELVSDSPRAWLDTLAFLGLDPMTRPTEAHNVTASKQRYSPLMRLLYDRGIARYEKRIPRWLKRALAPALLRGGKDYTRLLQSAKEAVPPAIVELLAADARAFENQIGWGTMSPADKPSNTPEIRTEAPGA